MHWLVRAGRWRRPPTSPAYRESPRGRQRPDRQHPDSPRRHRRAVGGSALPQQQWRALDLRRRRARRTHQACRRQELDLPRAPGGPTAAAGSWRAARSTARTSRNGWSRSGWALSYTRFSHDYDADEKAAREAKAGMWQGAFIAPWDWRVRNKKTAILGAAKPPENAHAILLASASGSVAPSPDCTIKGNVNQLRRMHLSHAQEPLVREDRDEDQQGHALVLLGRRGRSRGLPRDQAIARKGRSMLLTRLAESASGVRGASLTAEGLRPHPEERAPHRSASRRMRPLPQLAIMRNPDKLRERGRRG